MFVGLKEIREYMPSLPMRRQQVCYNGSFHWDVRSVYLAKVVYFNFYFDLFLNARPLYTVVLARSMSFVGDLLEWCLQNAVPLFKRSRYNKVAILQSQLPRRRR